MVHALLEQLVALDTSGTRPTRAAAAWAASQLEPLGAEIDLVEADGEQACVVARLGPPVDAERRGLVLCGHLDVVPAEEPDWETAPFTLVEREGRLHGRGACDMKGFVALALEAARRAAPRLEQPLVLVLTWGEERGALGARDLAERRPDLILPRAVIVGEPTGLRLVRMHKGHLKLRVIVSGASAHSGTPHLGRNVIVPAAAIVTALGRLGDAIAEERNAASACFPDVPGSVLTIARIAGGSAINMVPDRCTIELGIRLLPGMSSAPAIDRVRATVAEAMSAYGSGAGTSGAEAPPVEARVELINDTPTLLCPEDAPIVRALSSLLGQEESIGVAFASDAGVLEDAYDVDCVLWGPGSMAVAHRANEHVEVAALERGAALLDEAIEGMCVQP